MSLHAAGALRVADEEPDRALAALGRIEDAGRAALDDIRAVIGVLRADDPLALGPLDAPDRPIPSAPARDAAPDATPAAFRGRSAGARRRRDRRSRCSSRSPSRR